MTDTASPSERDLLKSFVSPLTFKAIAALAKLLPTSAAKSAPVEPSGKVRVDSSGRVTFISAIQRG